MYQIVLIFHIIASIVIIGLVLIQQGKGSDIGASFGSGASNTVFGSQGSGGFLFKLTGGIAALFFATSLGLGYIASSQYNMANAVISGPQTKKKVDDLVPVNSGDNSSTLPADKK